MIGNDMKAEKKIEAEKLLLCSMDQEQILNKHGSLQSYGIRNGSRLLLV